MLIVYLHLLSVPLLVLCWGPQGHSFGVSGTKELVVRVLGGSSVARWLAERHGFIYRGKVQGFSDTYVILPIENAFPTFQKRKSFSQPLINDSRVLWVDMQTPIQRQKRDFITPDPSEIPHERTKRLKESDGATFKRPMEISSSAIFNDELWNQQWYLDTRSRRNIPKLDLNVLPVYKSGITGKNIRISVLDDGLEYTHDDLLQNYDPEISYDCNEEDLDPFPRYNSKNSNNHGTRCAGEIAMAANNGICGVGVAFNAKIGGIKLLDGIVNDRIEGTALGYAYELVDIYSASWGPSDDGKTVDGPGRLALEAIERGVTKGRRGRGSIYVWASGNGGVKGDNCNVDGYLTNIHTITIGSASQRGEFPWYGEACASIMAVTYSSGAYKDQKITTTDLFNGCTIKHTGTSASAPLAAGIIALALEANPELTWRDVQHLTVWTSEPTPVADNPGWQRNGIGLDFNTRFGFGLMNGLSFVSSASNWSRVPEKNICTQDTEITNNSVKYGSQLVISIDTNACKNSKQEINFLEHVEIVTDIKYPRRGSLELFLTSPVGTKVQILAARKQDKSKKGFRNWSFMSVMTWGENPQGVWKVTITDQTGPPDNKGIVKKISLKLHGTRDLPEHMKYSRRYNKNHNNRIDRNKNEIKYYINNDYDDYIIKSMDK